MRYRKLTVYLFTLLFALAAMVLWKMEPRTEPLPIALTLTSAGEERTVTCWKNEAGEYYLFLPSYAQQHRAYLQILVPNVTIDGKPVTDGMSCGDFLPDTPYAFTFDSEDGPVSTALIFTQSKDLPALFLDTASGSMEHIHGKKGNRETGWISLYMPDGERCYTGNLDAVNGRGNDWLIPKKSYSLQLETEADLLGIGQAGKWILQANAFDASHLRNKLVYDFAGALGLAYSPESRWVDLYLNGEYAGLYLLCERNELHSQRVAPEGDGQYLVSMDVGWRLEENGKPFVTTQSGHAFRIYDSQINDNDLQRTLQSLENALTAEDGRDPQSGKYWWELIDLDSWAKKYLVEEIFGNSDGGAISQYFYGSASDGRIYAGPVWDFDVSMGNAQAPRLREPQTIFAGSAHIWSDIGPSWYYALSTQPAFYDRMVTLYREDCLPLLDTFLQETLDEYLWQIAWASGMNQLRWESLGSGQISIFEETENLRSYMEARIGFLNRLWLEQQPFHRVLIDARDGGFTTCFAVLNGEQIPWLPEYEPSPEILGWYIAGSEEPFDPAQPILSDLEIVLRRAEEPASAEAEGGGMLIQYAPFVLLTGMLIVFCLVDRHWQTAGTKKHSSEARISHRDIRKDS